MSKRDITCPECGATVRIPLYWVIGVEGIFYCKDCRKYFRINYKLGALLMGLAWASAWATVQLVAFFTSAVTVTVGVLAFIPLGIFYSFILRRAVLKLSLRRYSKKRTEQ